MARFKIGTEVTYAGNAEVYVITDLKQEDTGRLLHTSYLLKDIRGNKHWCHQTHILRTHKQYTKV